MYKTQFTCMIKPCMPLLFILFTSILSAQPSPIIATEGNYILSVKANANNALLDIKKLIPTIIIDLKYATEANFTHKKLYRKASTTYLRAPVARALLAIQQELAKAGYGLKIFDAYRPYATTVLMWQLIKDEAYVANPQYGSGHNRGTSVDVTIVQTSNRNELAMGTAFDSFTDSAWHSFTTRLSPQVQANRQILLNVMEKYGFKKLESEWWHYSWVSVEKYEVLNLTFKKLKKIIR